MDEIYGSNSSTGELPFHLPGQAPSTLPPLQEEQDDGNSATINGTINPALDQQVNMKLETEKDIQEWIKQRKLNWMKKISNKRPTEEPKQPIETQRRNTQRIQRIQKSQSIQRSPHQHQKAQKNSRFNLSNKIIQRELATKENTIILEFIKKLFDNKVIDN